jgi:Ca2+:H+ antiporter
VVASIEETADRYSIPKPFIGLILIPIVVRDLTLLHIWDVMRLQGNAAEHVTAVFMAMKGRMETTITICVGSSIVSHPVPEYKYN